MAKRSTTAHILVTALVLVQCWAAAGAENGEGDAGGRENQPPVLVSNIPLQSFPEDNIGNKGYHLVNLSKFFSDDGGDDNLAFTVVYAEGPSNISATIDGRFVSFTAMREDWIGQERFRVRATDAGGLWTESNNFTVRVTPGPSYPKFGPLPDVVVEDGEEYFFDLTPYIMEVDSRLDNVTVRTNSSFVRAEGTTLFIKVSSDEPSIDVCITVNDTFDEYSGNLRIWVFVPPIHDHFNGDPYLIILHEDEIYSCSLIGQFGPLNPDTVWTVDSVNAGDPPSFSAKILDNNTLRIDAALHRYGKGWNITTTASVPGGQKYHYVFNVTVQGISILHRLVLINDTTVSEHQNVSFRLIKEDPWDNLRFRTNTTLFNITPEGWVNFTPDQKEVGRWRIFYTVEGFDIVKREFNLTVLNVNEPPENATILKPKDQARFTVGKRIDFECNASDVDSDQLKYEWRSSGVVFGMGKRFSTSNLKVGRYAFYVNVSDGQFSIESPPVTILVMPKTETEVAGPDYTFIFAIIIAVCIIAACLGVALYVPYRPR